MNKTVMAIILCGVFTLPANTDAISGARITSVNSGGTSL
jgi:hypothetical protein